MKTIILTVAVAVLGLTSCTKENLTETVDQTEMIQGEWNNNAIWVSTPTVSNEPAEWLNVTIEGNTWIYENSEPVTFQIQDDVIYFSNGGTNNVDCLTEDVIVLSKTLSNGNFQKLVLNRN